MTVFSLSGAFVTVMSLLMAVAMLAQLKNKVNFIWGFFCLLVMTWGIGAYGVGVASTALESLSWWRIGYLGVVFIPSTFVYFVYVFLKKKTDIYVFVLFVISLVYLILDVFANQYFLPGTKLAFNGLLFWAYRPPFFIFDIFTLFFFSSSIYAHILLFKAYRKSYGAEKKQIQYFFLGSSIGYFGGIFDFLGVYTDIIYPFPNFLVALYPLIMGYAILKYGLFNFKVVATELLTFSIWGFLLVKLFLSKDMSEFLVSGGLLLIVVVFGSLLIKSVLNEVNEREDLEKISGDLNDLKGNLEIRIKEQSEQVKKAYEIEKKARLELEELDKDKDKFILATQHHLRTPITIIKGYLNSLRGGVDNNSEIGGIFSSMNGEAENISNSVNDLLRATEIKVNKQNGS